MRAPGQRHRARREQRGGEPHARERDIGGGEGRGAGIPEVQEPEAERGQRRGGDDARRGREPAQRVAPEGQLFGERREQESDAQRQGGCSPPAPPGRGGDSGATRGHRQAHRARRHARAQSGAHQQGPAHARAGAPAQLLPGSALEHAAHQPRRQTEAGRPGQRAPRERPARVRVQRHERQGVTRRRARHGKRRDPGGRGGGGSRPVRKRNARRHRRARSGLTVGFRARTAIATFARSPIRNGSVPSRSAPVALPVRISS